jgi:hypothetical protein
MSATPLAVSSALLLALLGLAAPAVAQTQLIDSNGLAGDNFGGSHDPTTGFGLAMDGDVLVGGCPDDESPLAGQGSAAVFRWDGSSWVEEAELVASDGGTGETFGNAVAVSGDVIVVGAPDDNIGFGFDVGSAYVYRWDGAAWNEEQKLQLIPGATSDNFGSDVAIDGDRIVVGTPLDDSVMHMDSGSASVFEYDGSSWGQTKLLTVLDESGLDGLGSSVDIDGDVIVVGMWMDDESPVVDGGSARVWRHDGSDWVYEQALLPSSASTFELYGRQVAVSGDVIAVGGHFADPGGSPGQGVVAMFRWDGATWNEEALLSPSNGATGDLFGGGLDLEGDLLVGGAPFGDIGGGDWGYATLFRYDGIGWAEEQDLFAADGANGDAFGNSIAISGGRIAVGAPKDDILLGPVFGDRGSVWVYDDAGPWTDEGCALAGVSGDPLLEGSGPLSDGSSNQVELSNAAPSAVCGLFLALSSTPTAFKGGTLKPVPFLIEPVILTTSPAGGVLLPFVMPPAIPAGTELWVQYAVQDAAAVHNVALSNAVKGVTP